MTEIRILIVEDHQLMIDAYCNIISEMRYSCTYSYANDCESAEKIIKDGFAFDLVILDRAIPSSENCCNGEDLAMMIKKHIPDAKIMFITSHEEIFVLYNINLRVKPDALLLKTDVTSNVLKNAILAVLNGDIFYSANTREKIKIITSQYSYLDNLNRQIITLLSQGVKTKNLTDHLPLSNSAIDKRKSYIKEYLNIDKGNDEDIIKQARSAGFI